MFRRQHYTSWPVTGLLFAAVVGLLALAGWFSPPAAQARSIGSVNPHSALRTPQYANALVHGRVLWKNTEDVAPGVQLQLSDATTKEVVMQGATDATGWYTLTVGVGTWLLDIPSTAQYYGYAQEVTILPHGEYLLDFAISPRPASDTPPTALPGAASTGPLPAVPTPGSLAPITANTGPATLPTNGQPADPTLFIILGIVALVVIGVGVVLLRRSRGG